MRLTFFVVWKSWVSNPIRTVLTVLGVALGIAVVTAIHVLDHNTIHSRLQQRIADYGRVDLELLPKQPSRKPDDVRRQLSAMTDSVQSVGLLHGGDQGAAAVLSAGGAQAEVRLYGLSPLPSRSFAFYNVEAGEDLTDLDGDEFVLVASTVAKLGVKVGQELRLAPARAIPRPKCVDGKLVSSTEGFEPGETVTVKVKGILSHHALARRSGGMVVVGSFSLARRVAPHDLTFYQINRVGGSNPESLKQALETNYQVLDKRSAMLGEGADERAFRNGIKILGLLALVLGMLVVFQTLSQTLLERLRQIGLMRCLGASRRAVAAIFLVDGLLLAGVGAFLGVAGGIGLAYLLAANQVTTLGMGKPITDFEVPLRPNFFAAGLGIFFTLAGSAFPLFKARNLPPMQVLQARGLGDSGYLLRGVNVFLFLLLVIVLPISYLAMTPLMAEEGRETTIVLLQVVGIVMLFGGVLLLSPKLVRVGGAAVLYPFERRLPLPTFLVQKAMSRGPGRFAAAVCGLAVVLVALIALKHITYSLRAEVKQFSAQTMDDHLFFAIRESGATGGIGATDPENTKYRPRRVTDLAAIQAIDGVRDVEFVAGEVHVGYLMRGLPLDCLVRDGAPLEDRLGLFDAYRTRRSLVVSKRWAELHWKKAGQSVDVLTGAGSKRYEILLVSDAAGFFPDEKAWVVTSPQWLKQDFCLPDASVDRIAVRALPGADLAAVRASVQAIFPHNWFKSGHEIRAYLLRDVTKDFLLFDALLLLILFLVGVGLVNTMTIAAVGRAREIGVLRALGMEDQSLRQTFLVEGLVVAGLGAGLAIVMGLPLGFVVVEGLNRVAGLEAPVVIPWLYVALVPVLALLTGVLAAILPGSRAIKMDPAEAVRYE